MFYQRRALQALCVDGGGGGGSPSDPTHPSRLPQSLQPVLWQFEIVAMRICAPEWKRIRKYNYDECIFSVLSHCVHQIIRSRRLSPSLGSSSPKDGTPGPDGLCHPARIRCCQMTIQSVCQRRADEIGENGTRLRWNGNCARDSCPTS